MANGTSESLAFPSGFVSAIEGIETGGGGDTSVEDGIITKTISGSYYNSRVTKIEDYAFNNCIKLTTVNFPACTNIDAYAFSNCTKLTTVSFPVCSLIANSAFCSCTGLTIASFPACSLIASYAFNNCAKLTTASFPICKYILNYAFAYCSSLTTANFPACINISPYAFIQCYSLTTVSFPVCMSISNNAFQKCRNLLSVYLMGSSIPSLSGSGAFSSTPIAGYTEYTGGVYGSIYVPASMLESYKTATNWSYFSDRFVGVE